MLITMKQNCMYTLLSQAHKLHDNIHDIELSTLDAKTVGEVKYTSSSCRYCLSTPAHLSVDTRLCLSL